jgi:hypothetical protein
MSRPNATKKLLKSQVANTVDLATGEVKQSEELQEYSVQTEPAFVKLYLENIKMLYDLTVSNHKILNELLKICNYGGEIILNSSVKKRICESLETSIGSFDNSLLKLKQQDIIRQEVRGIYYLNPELFGKGPWSSVYQDRAKYKKIKMTIEFSGDKNAKKTVKTELVDDVDALTTQANLEGLTYEQFVDTLETEEFNIDNTGYGFDEDALENE